jgi:hypothetical protein
MGVQRVIVINTEKAKNIAHDIRRAKRSEEFAPLDIKATVPHLAAEAEAARQEIRSKYEVIQNEINATSDIKELSDIVRAMQ